MSYRNGSIRLVLLALLGAGLLPACASMKGQTTPQPTGKIRRLQLEPLKLLAVDGKVEVLDANGLFEAASRQMDAKKYHEAIVHYDRLLKHFPSSALTVASLYNAGLAHEALGDFAAAARRYQRLISLATAVGRTGIDAEFRLGGCYAELRAWPRSAKVFHRLASRADLPAGDRIEAFARKGLALYQQGDYPATERELKRAIAFATKVQATERLDNDFFLSMAYFYLGAMPHARFRRAEVKSGKRMGQQLDAKAKLLLLSQRRYIQTIRQKNPYWATAAGFQIGSLYKEFYTTLMTTLPDFKGVAKKNARLAKITPAQAEQQLLTTYLEEVHKRVKPLLAKAIRVFERNVVVGDRIGIRSSWVQRSRHQVGELKRLLLASPADAIKLIPKKGIAPEDEGPRNKSINPAGDQPGTPTSQPANNGTSAGRAVI